MLWPVLKKRMFSSLSSAGKARIVFFLSLLGILGGAVLLAWAGGQGGVTLGGVPAFALAVGLAFLLNGLAFLPAYLLQTEKFFDLTGSLTFLSMTGLTLWAALRQSLLDERATLVSVLVVIWAVRLGTFLFHRIQKAGGDDRFTALKSSSLRFLTVWMLQALWASVTLAPALVVMTSLHRKPLDGFALAGALLWLVGFLIEVVADAQKSRFRAEPANRGRFIQSGLWARSRHPNYFGEILLWTGIALIALPVLQGWQLLTVLSPFFVAFLLTRVSGIPLLERRAEERWGTLPEYQEYKRRTPLLIPRLW